MLERIPPLPAHGFFLGHTLFLGTRNKPTFFTYGTQHTALNDFFAKSSEQLLLALVWLQVHSRQLDHSFY
jgi:hypothetical protein